MVALAVNEEQEQQLEWLGVKDSKLLSREAREEMFERIREIVTDFRIEVIEPDAIDHALTDTSLNLNWLEAETSARMISELNPDVVIVDCPSINLEAYKTYFESRLSEGVKNNIKIQMEHKADARHLVVAAASIIAKVLRDRAIDNIKEEVGADFGSGYMSDERTQKFLRDNYAKYPHIFRKEWKSYKNAVEFAKQRTMEDFFSS
jgi:ribonuclease HII